MTGSVSTATLPTTFVVQFHTNGTSKSKESQPSTSFSTPKLKLLCATDAMASDYINVALMSGRIAQVPVTMDRPLKRVKLEAQSALQTSIGVLRDLHGRILDDCQTVGAAGLKSGDSLTLQVRQTRLASHKFCFARGWIRGHVG